VKLHILNIIKVAFFSVVAAGLLSGCSGGAGDKAEANALPLTLSGVAAEGSPIVGGTINVICVSGSALTSTGNDGTWQVDITGRTLPCAVQVSGGTMSATYHSIALAPGNVNITPLTDLMVANLAGTASPSVWFDSLKTAPANLGQITSTQTALDHLRTALPELTALATTAIDPITTPFTATPGNTVDDMLAAMKMAVNNSGVAYAALLTDASYPLFNSPGTSFSDALAAAATQVTATFPFQAGYKALIASGFARNFTVSGDCEGAGSRTIAPATTAATFELVAGLSAATSLTVSLSSCTNSAIPTPTTLYQTSTTYFDNNYVPRGVNINGGYYGVWSPLSLPVTVTVGGKGSIGTETLYTDSTKATGYGTMVQSYEIEADTATTTIVNLTTVFRNASNELTGTEQDRYRIDSIGIWTPISADIVQDFGGSPMHWLLIYN
jgi:hypothetical protein